MFNSKKTLWFVVSVTFNVAFLVALIYMIQFNNMHRWRGRRPNFKVNWTETEKTGYDSLQMVFRENVHVLRDSISAEEGRLARMLIKSNPSSEELDPYIMRINRLKAEFHKALVLQLLKERDSLNPENRDAFMNTMLRRSLRTRNRGSGDSTGTSAPAGQ